MKMRILLFIGIFIQFNVFAQNTTLISFDYQEEALTEVMNDLADRYVVNFSFANDPYLLGANITASADDIPLEKGLDLIFDDQPITYKLMSGQVVLRYKEILSENKNQGNQNIVPEPQIVPESSPERITYEPTREEVSDVEPLVARRPGLFSLNMSWDDEEEDHRHSHSFGNHDGAGGLEFYTSEIFNFHLSFKSGGDNFYHMLNLSSDRIWPWNYKRSDPQWALGVGVGFRTFLYRIPLRTELIVNHINEDKFISTRLNELAQFRFMLGVPFLGGEITIGPSFNFHISGVLDEETNQIGSNLLPGWEVSEKNEDIGYYYWVGATIGFLF